MTEERNIFVGEGVNAPRMVEIKQVKVDSPLVKTFTLDTSLPGVRPGQFLMLWIPGIDQKPFSLSRLDPVEVSVKSVGKFTEAMNSLETGDLVGVQGPYGNGFKVTGDRVCILGGGVGIAPLAPLAEEATGKCGKVTAVLGAKTADELILVDRFKSAGAEVIEVTDDGSCGLKCFVPDALEKLLKEGRKFDQIYSCGSEAMMKKILDLAVNNKLAGQFSVERYMKCGFGVCGQCSIDPKGMRVCKDGPVFTVEVLVDSEFGKYTRNAAGSRKGVE